MQHQHLITRLRRQREMLDELISKIGETDQLDSVNLMYDATTRKIEKDLLELRKSFFQNKNKETNSLPAGRQGG